MLIPNHIIKINKQDSLAEYMENLWWPLEFDVNGGALQRGGLISNFESEERGSLEREAK